MKNLLYDFINLFKSNGATPNPNIIPEVDYVAEYLKVKDTLILKDISVCLMQDGKYKVINKGRPEISLMSFQGIGTSKEMACRICVNYYKNKLKHDKANTIVERI